MRQRALNKNNPDNILSVGINFYKSSLTDCSTHAERNALDKLPTVKKLKRLVKIDILVIRTSSTGVLGMSKPCSKCISDMSIYPQRKGYSIRNIYYSGEDGEIICTNLAALLSSDDKHVSRYYRNH
jgi:hypothetical protein